MGNLQTFIESARLLLWGVVKRVWSWLLLAFVTFPGAYDRYKWIFPRDMQVASMPLWVSLGLLGIGLSYAILMTYHELNMQAKARQHRLDPTFDIMYGNDPPFEEREILAGSQEVQWRYFRIGIKNIGGATVEDVVVRLEELYDLVSDPPAKSPVPPVILRQMNDNPFNGQYQQSFILHPGQIQYIDVAWKPEAAMAIDPDQIRLGYAQASPSLISCRRHELLIQATGRNVSAKSQWFFVDVNQDGQLMFGPKN